MYSGGSGTREQPGYEETDRLSAVALSLHRLVDGDTDLEGVWRKRSIRRVVGLNPTDHEAADLDREIQRYALHYFRALEPGSKRIARRQDGLHGRIHLEPIGSLLLVLVHRERAEGHALPFEPEESCPPLASQSHACRTKSRGRAFQACVGIERLADIPRTAPGGSRTRGPKEDPLVALAQLLVREIGPVTRLGVSGRGGDV